MMTDETIKKDVVGQLYWDSRIDASDISVNVDDGNVRLEGNVSGNRARIAAQEDAMSVVGVRSVTNELDVVYAADTLPEDDKILTDIKSVLRTDPDIDSSSIEVYVQDGIATLKGEVASFWKKQTAEDDAWRVIGVVDVMNELAVVPTKKLSDADISKDIIAAYERNAYVEPHDIEVKIENGMVTLSGTVPSWQARAEAVDIARYTLGVLAVDDDELAIT